MEGDATKGIELQERLGFHEDEGAWKQTDYQLFPGMRFIEEEIKRSVELRETEFENIIQLQEMQNRDLQERLKSRVDDNMLKAITKGNAHLKEHVAVLSSSLYTTQTENEKTRRAAAERSMEVKLRVSVLEAQNKELTSELQLMRAKHKEYCTKQHEDMLEIEALSASVKSLEGELGEAKDLAEILKRELARERAASLEKYREYELVKESTRANLEAQISELESRLSLEKVEHQRGLQQRQHAESQLKEELRLREQAFHEALGEHSKAIHSHRTEINDVKQHLQTEISKLKERLGQAAKQNDALASTLRQSEDTCNEFRSRAGNLHQQVQWYATEKAHLESQLAAVTQTIEQQESSLSELAGVHADSERYRLQYEFAKGESAHLQEELEYTKQELAKLEVTQKNRYTGEISALKSDVKTLTEALNKGRVKYTRMKLKFAEQIALAEQRVIDAIEGLKVRDLRGGERPQFPSWHSPKYTDVLDERSILY